MWQAWERAGVLPASGGWMDQPLPLLVLFGAMNLIRGTWQYYRRDDFDWNKLSPTQTDLVVWMESD